MNSICLSVAPNLRCQGLTRLEHIVLIIPPAVELVFSFTLAVTSASVEGRNRWILVLDGLSFFLLALSDFFAHIIPKASSSVHAFSTIDITIAAISFLPLLFYTVFLFLFARTALITFVPTRFSRLITFSLLAAIPLILAANELGSLIGLAHTTLPTPPNHTTIVGVGFSSSFHQHVSLFFSSACLALLSLFQALLFMVSFIRIVRGFIEERRIEAAKQDPQAREEIHLFRGLGWFALGLKLGAIESVVGFANISFAVVITRRTLRLFARGTVIIGVMKGLDIMEDITSLESDIRVRSLTTRRLKSGSRRLSWVMISNPRNSTFQQLSPKAFNFHAAQATTREKRGRIGPSPLALGSGSNMARFNDVDFKDPEFQSPDFNSPIFDNPKLNTPVFNSSRSSVKTNQRVTVHYDGKTPPVLQLRFSVVDIDVHPVPLLPNPLESNLRGPSPGHTNGHIPDQDDGPKSAPLHVVAEEPREDQVSLSEPGWDRELFYGGYVPKTAPLPHREIVPPRPPRDPRRTSYATPDVNSDVAMPFQERDRDSPPTSLDSPRSSTSLSRYVPSSSRDIPAASLHRSARAISGASDSLSIVHEIAARFPGLPPRVVPGKMPSRTDPVGTQSWLGGATSLSFPPGLRAEDADSDTEWRTLARARSMKRRQEMEMEAQQAGARGGTDQGDGVKNAAAGTGTDISPMNSIKRKPAPSSDESLVNDMRLDEAISEAVITRAAVTARAARSANEHRHSPSLDDPSSYYSSSEDGSDDGEFTYTTQNAGAEMGELTSTPWTPATTVTVATGLRTPGSWVGGEERPMGRLAGPATAIRQSEDLNAYPSAQVQANLQPQQRRQKQQKHLQLQLQPQPQPQSQPRSQPHQQGPVGDGATLEERRRLGRLTLLRRELRASVQDSAAANAALEPELQAPWLHTDPLTQLQTIGSGTLSDEDEDAVLDDAWRRAGLTRIKSVSRVRVHTTPRVEQGFEVRGSLMAVEEEDEEAEDLGVPVTPTREQEWAKRTSASTLKKPARLDSGVLGEEDRQLIQQGITV